MLKKSNGFGTNVTFRMSPARSWIARGSILSIAPLIEYACRFIRIAILSRFLSANEFGIAVAITVVMGIAALVSDVAIDKFVVVGKQDNRTLAASHLLSVGRGCLLGSVLLICAPFAASEFGVPEQTASFALVAFFPLVQAFAHLGIKQVQFNHQYGPEVLSQSIAQLTAIFAVMSAVYIMPDHRAVLASFAAEYLVYVVASHVLARSPFEIHSDRDRILTALAFGLPLLFNGVGLAIIGQFDRALVGHFFGVQALASYAVVLSVSVAPIALALRVMGTMSMSQFRQWQSNDRVPGKKYDIVVLVFSVAATAYALAVATSIDFIVPLIFGRQFGVNVSVHLMIIIICYLRFQMAGAPTNLLLATRQTGQLALLNLSGAVGLLSAIVCEVLYPSFDAFILGLLIGDVVRFPLFFVLPQKRGISGQSRLVPDQLVGLSVVALIVLMVAWFPNPSMTVRAMLVGAGAFAVGLQATIGLFRHRSFVFKEPKGDGLSARSPPPV